MHPALSLWMVLPSPLPVVGSPLLLPVPFSLRRAPQFFPLPLLWLVLSLTSLLLVLPSSSPIQWIAPQFFFFFFSCFSLSFGVETENDKETVCMPGPQSPNSWRERVRLTHSVYLCDQTPDISITIHYSMTFLSVFSSSALASGFWEPRRPTVVLVFALHHLGCSIRSQVHVKRTIRHTVFFLFGGTLCFTCYMSLLHVERSVCRHMSHMSHSVRHNCRISVLHQSSGEALSGTVFL